MRILLSFRFNGLDNRLERAMESVCLVMEAFEGYKDKFLVNIENN